MRARPRTAAAVAVLLALAGPARAGTLLGTVFSADHPDSLARLAADTLVYHVQGGSLQLVPGRTDDRGRFRFPNLPADTTVAYVLKITYGGRDFLSSPIHFQPGEDQVEFNLLLSDKPPQGAQGQEGELPPGHPSVPGEPATGRPARVSPVHTILIVLWIVALFAVFAVLARRRTGAAEPGLPPGARALARDIASLDLRHDDGVIGDEEYRKVRAGLLERLRSLARGPKG